MLLSAEQVSKTYGDRTVLDQVSFYLEPGDKVGVIGLNGTLEALVAGVITALISAPVAAVLSRQRR